MKKITVLTSSFFRTGLSAFRLILFLWAGSLQAQWTQLGADINKEAALYWSDNPSFLSSDGNTLAIGSSYGSINAKESGYVRIYVWNGTDWAQRGADIKGEAAGDNSGRAISLSSDGNILAVGAPYNSGSGNESGHVRVYVWNGTDWLQRGADIDGKVAGDNSGGAVSLSFDGNVLAVGAANNSGAGHVRVYVWNGTDWKQRGDDISGEAPGDKSGRAVSLSSEGNVLAIGAPNNSRAGEGAGHVRVYVWNGTDWKQRGDDIDGEAAFDNSGWSVSLSSDGNILAVGAPYNSDAGEYAGHVRVYVWNGTDWLQRGADIDGKIKWDLSGDSVSLSSDGNVLAVGAFGNGLDAGYVRTYAWDGTDWTEGEKVFDRSSNSVSLSADGNTLAFGILGNYGNDGQREDHVRVFVFKK